MSEHDLTGGGEAPDPEEIHEDASIAPVDVPDEIEERLREEREDEERELDA